MPAHRDNDVELNFAQVVDRLRILLANINLRFRHDGNCVGIETMFFQAGRKGLKFIFGQRLGPTFRHLATTRIPGAKKQHIR